MSVAEIAITERIQRLEATIARLQEELAQAEAGAVMAGVMGELRARAAILLYVGTKTPDALRQEFMEAFGVNVAQQAMRHLFYLNNAPVSPLVLNEMRTAFDGGMSRW